MANYRGVKPLTGNGAEALDIFTRPQCYGSIFKLVSLKGSEGENL